MDFSPYRNKSLKAGIERFYSPTIVLDKIVTTLHMSGLFTPNHRVLKIVTRVTNVTRESRNEGNVTRVTTALKALNVLF